MRSLCSQGQEVTITYFMDEIGLQTRVIGNLKKKTLNKLTIRIINLEFNEI